MVDNIAEWLRQNELSLNADKTEYMVVGHKWQTSHILRPIEVNVYEEAVKRVKKVKYLGTIVDENLTWNEQYEKLKCKIETALSSPQKFENMLLQSTLDQVYKELFESQLRYNDELWGNLSNTALASMSTN